MDSVLPKWEICFCIDCLILEIYKYNRKEFVAAALEQGSIRLGTLFDYRKADHHGAQVGDANEGKVILGGMLENVTHETTAGHPALERLLHLGPGAKVGKLLVSNYSIESEDLFIFSASSAFSEAALERWFVDPQARYDSCYRIHSARLFFREISRKLDGKADFLGYGPVHYYDSEAPIPLTSSLARLHPGQLKGGTIYGHQTEIRAFWRPRSPGPIQPEIVPIPELRKYCCHRFTRSSGAVVETDR